MNMLLQVVLFLERFAIHDVQHGTSIVSFILANQLPTVECVLVALTIISHQPLHSYSKVDMLGRSIRQVP